MTSFLFIQGLGVIGWIFLLISYWRKDINEVLLFQLFGSIFDILHYYFLKATTGLFVVAFELIRDFSYYKTNLDKYIFICTIPIYIIFGLVSITNIVEILPLIASIVDGYTLSVNKNLAIKGAIIANIFWIIYDAILGSYIGVLAGVVIIISNSLILLKTSKLLKVSN
jgi:hypothetical protein